MHDRLYFISSMGGIACLNIYCTIENLAQNYYLKRIAFDSLHSLSYEASDHNIEAIVELFDKSNSMAAVGSLNALVSGISLSIGLYYLLLKPKNSSSGPCD